MFYLGQQQWIGGQLSRPQGTSKRIYFLSASRRPEDTPFERLANSLEWTRIIYFLCPGPAFCTHELWLYFPIFQPQVQPGFTQLYSHFHPGFKFWLQGQFSFRWNCCYQVLYRHFLLFPFLDEWPASAQIYDWPSSFQPLIIDRGQIIFHQKMTKDQRQLFAALFLIHPSSQFFDISPDCCEPSR